MSARIPSFDDKNPADALIIHRFGFAKLLASSVVVGETIASVGNVTCSPSGLTLGTPTPDAANVGVLVPISAGIVGQNYLVSVTFTTNGGQTLTRSAYLPVRAI